MARVHAVADYDVATPSTGDTVLGLHGSEVSRFAIDPFDHVNAGDAFTSLSTASQDWLNGGFGQQSGPQSVVQVISINPTLNWDAGAIAGVTQHSVANATQLTQAGIYGAGFGTFANGVTGKQVRGGDFDALMLGSGTCSFLHGSVSYVQQSTGTVGTMSAIRASGYKPAGTATNFYGLYVDSIYAAGTISGNWAAIGIDTLTGATTGTTVHAIITGDNPSQFGSSIKISGAALTDAANDGAAASAGVAVGSMYRNGSVLMIRVA